MSEQIDVVPRKRDPQRRRREIVDAAAALIVEVGSGGLTHRLVAARAAVPLGSTTQYFATLDDLREAALVHLADQVDAALSDVATRLGEVGPSPVEFARALHEYMCDEQVVRTDVALVSAAIVDPTLRPLALRWSDGLVDLLTPTVGRTAARAVTAFIDGASIHALLNEQPMTVDELTEILTALAGGVR